jgi:hypothetical protein
VKTQSPRITRLSWGKLEIEGGQTFKDAVLYPGGARDWDWRVTGTQHQPGIQPDDVQELIDRGAKVVVLARGMYERLQVRADTLELLEKHGIDVHALQTEKAVDRYNELIAAGPVGALIHSTC